MTPVVLTGEALACADCGQAVAMPDPELAVKVECVRNGRATRVPMTKCQRCDERDRAAVALARQHLPVGVTFDGRRYSGKDAARLLVEAHAAFDAAGVERTRVEIAEKPAAVLTSEIAHLSSEPGRLRWRDQLNAPRSLIAEPVPLVEPGSANPHPWAHLGDADLARLRTAIGKVVAERVARSAPPVALAPPHSTDALCGGCLFCGVGTVTVSAVAVVRLGGADAAARSVWTQRQVSPMSLGARSGGSTRLRGWLCPACEHSAAETGSANSPAAMEHALSTHLGVSTRTLAGDQLQVSGLQGWGALVADAIHCSRPAPSANVDPWSHLTAREKEALARDWRRGG